MSAVIASVIAYGRPVFHMGKEEFERRIGEQIPLQGEYLILCGKNCQDDALLNKVLTVFAEFSQIKKCPHTEREKIIKNMYDAESITGISVQDSNKSLLELQFFQLSAQWIGKDPTQK